jgi:hypothetical protein
MYNLVKYLTNKIYVVARCLDFGWNLTINLKAVVTVVKKKIWRPY